MEHFHGNMVKGELSGEKEFVITQIKNLDTQSVLHPNQLQAMYQYLSKQLELSEDCIITVNDQLPVRLNGQDTESLHQDINQLMNIMNLH
ncbi:hypothetical protein [Salinibacillus xinjiangensis]|uniref:Uncharacterized protein n=1 Tax=Salinibacillus xinjiangensis TaxID=1229268 RepID=A0A6G1X4F0_9BACI|nr:hypothetical protein [Salinibacillus xinjiangensis]MRG85822.1 hypothetical protein [Salinibacillus xinjiangensis]